MSTIRPSRLLPWNNCCCRSPWVTQDVAAFSAVDGHNCSRNAGEGKAKDFLNTGLDEGVMVLVAGANVVRLAPSLIIPETDIEEALERFEAAVKKITAK